MTTTAPRPFAADFTEVSADQPCPVCGKDSWCALHRSGRKVLCQRSAGGKPTRSGGWLHYLPPGTVAPATSTRAPRTKPKLTRGQIRAYRTSLCRDYLDPLFKKHAALLGVSTFALEQLDCGYDVDGAVLAFPMVNACRVPVGYRFRRRDGRKWSLKGSQEGIFMPKRFDPTRPIFITEGPTDATALLDAGLRNVIGRPSCSGGQRDIVALLDEHRRTPVVILADPDDPGIAGAERLAGQLPNPCIVITGEVDIRDYVTGFRRTGVAAEVILEVVAGQPRHPWRIVSHNLSGRCYNFGRLARKA